MDSDRNNMWIMIGVAILLVLIVLVYFFIVEGTPSTPSGELAPTSTAGTSSALANPASVYCADQEGQLRIITRADGSQSGLCVFSDGSSCDEWAYYRGQCTQGGTGTPPRVPEATGTFSGTTTR